MLGKTIADDAELTKYVVNIAGEMECAYHRYVKRYNEFKEIARTFNITQFDLVVDRAMKMRDAYKDYDNQYTKLSQLCYALGGKYIDMCERAVRHQEVVV